LSLTRHWGEKKWESEGDSCGGGNDSLGVYNLSRLGSVSLPCRVRPLIVIKGAGYYQENPETLKTRNEIKDFLMEKLRSAFLLKKKAYLLKRKLDGKKEKAALPVLQPCRKQLKRKSGGGGILSGKRLRRSEDL